MLCYVMLCYLQCATTCAIILQVMLLRYVVLTAWYVLVCCVMITWLLLCYDTIWYDELAALLAMVWCVTCIIGVLTYVMLWYVNICYVMLCYPRCTTLHVMLWHVTWLRNPYMTTHISTEQKHDSKYIVVLWSIWPLIRNFAKYKTKYQYEDFAIVLFT